jgi:hypothetical protein
MSHVSRRRSLFTADEDAVIRKAMQSYVPEPWSTIAMRLPGRTARQCRDRWIHYLSPFIRIEHWTPEEDRLLLEKVNEMGRLWKAITPFFVGRTDNHLKNRWYTHLRASSEQYRRPGDDSKAANPDRCELLPSAEKLAIQKEEKAVEGPIMAAAEKGTEAESSIGSRLSPPDGDAVTMRAQQICTCFVFDNSLKKWTQRRTPGVA